MNLKKKLLVAALATAMVFPTVSMASKLNVQRYSGSSRVETAVTLVRTNSHQQNQLFWLTN